MIKHKHHIIPRHAGGTDDPSNIIELTIKEHAEAHRKLYKQHGRYEDKVAWHMLSGQITAQEARILTVKGAKNRARKREDTRKLWKDPEERAKRMKSLRKSARANRKKTSEITRLRWQDPKSRRKLMAGIRKKNQDSEYVKRRIERARLACAGIPPKERKKLNDGIVQQ